MVLNWIRNPSSGVKASAATGTLTLGIVGAAESATVTISAVGITGPVVNQLVFSSVHIPFMDASPYIIRAWQSTDPSVIVETTFDPRTWTAPTPTATATNTPTPTQTATATATATNTPTALGSQLDFGSDYVNYFAPDTTAADRTTRYLGYGVAALGVLLVAVAVYVFFVKKK